MQADVEHVHAQRGGREHERDRDHHDHPRAQAEADQADDEHDRDRLGDRLDEIVDRLRDRVRHARDRHELKARGQGGLQAMSRGVERLAERDHVARGRHRDADAERVLVAEAHIFGRRVGVAALDLRDVAQADHAAIDADQRVAIFATSWNCPLGRT